MSARAFLPAALLAVTGCAPVEPSAAEVPGLVSPAQWAKACEDSDDWDRPAPPHHIHGNTYHVGTCGISAILVTGDEGHVLIDSGTEAGAQIVLANLTRLGIAPGDIRLLLHSHEHFDHVGGMALLREATGAVLLASAPARAVFETGIADPADPQAGLHEPMAPVTVDRVVSEGETVRLGNLALTPVATPGHTPGALSWTWRSCDGADCRAIVYADSLSPISRDGYRFSDNPGLIRAYRHGLARLAAQPCDMLLTPHPSASGMVENARAGRAGGSSGCADYAATAAGRLGARLAQEAAAAP